MKHFNALSLYSQVNLSESYSIRKLSAHFQNGLIHPRIFENVHCLYKSPIWGYRKKTYTRYYDFL